MACASFCATGHLVYMSKAAEALVEAGHEGYFITQGNEHSRKMAERMMEPSGVKMLYTETGAVAEDW